MYRWNGERWEGVYRNPTSGRWNKCRNYGLLLGERSKFEDPHSEGFTCGGNMKEVYGQDKQKRKSD